MGHEKGSVASNERSKETLKSPTLLPLSPPNSRNMACQNRYAALLPEVEEHEAFDIMEDIDNATAEDDGKTTEALREAGAVKKPPKKRSRLRAGAKAFTEDADEKGNRQIKSRSCELPPVTEGTGEITTNHRPNTQRGVEARTDIHEIR